MNLAAFLIGMVGPLAARLITAFGVSLITMTGLAAAVATFKAQIISSLSGLPSDGLLLGGLLGIWQAIGMYLGALAFVVAWASTKGFIGVAKAGGGGGGGGGGFGG